MKDQFEVFLTLTRLGIGHSTTYIHKQIINWDIVQVIAREQGLSAVVLDGIERLPDSARPNKITLLNWVGEVLQTYEQRYNKYCNVIAELAEWNNSHGLRIMVLKGYSCALNWPKPEHRPCGDIDIWQFGRQREADAAWAKEKEMKVDNSHHHHTVFEWRGFIVENHYDFINVHHHKSNVEFEAILKELGQDDSHYVELYGEKVYIPSPNLQALFLLKHLMAHFAAEGITLRHIMDWGFFVKAYGKNVDWKMVLDVLERFGMKEMFNILNAICVEDLGFDPSFFPQVQFNPVLKDKVLNEVLSPIFSIQTPHGFLKRVAFKLQRWISNAWKHKLCYKESMWSAFWSGLWNHLIKPSSI